MSASDATTGPADAIIRRGPVAVGVVASALLVAVGMLMAVSSHGHGAASWATGIIAAAAAAFVLWLVMSFGTLGRIRSLGRRDQLAGRWAAASRSCVLAAVPCLACLEFRSSQLVFLYGSVILLLAASYCEGVGECQRTTKLK